MSISQSAYEIIQEVKKVLCGKDPVITKVMIAIIAGGNILMEDIPGVGKTTMAMAFAKAMDLDTRRMQFTADVMPSDVVGFSMFNVKTQEFEQRNGAVVCNLFLADEINRTSSKTQSALLEAMEEKQVTIDGKTVMLPEPFIVIATQNPIGSAGTQMLPESQVDRFMICISMGYPDVTSEMRLISARQDDNPLNAVRTVAGAADVLKMQKEASEIYMDDAVLRYAVELCNATRHSENITLGASPRATLALVNFAKAYAYVMGKTFVSPTDIQSVFSDVIRHRLVLSNQARVAGKNKDSVIAEIIKSINVPGVK